MSRVLGLVEEARASGDFSRLSAAIPYTHFLGIVIDTEGGEMVGKMPFADHLVGNPVLPALHGGAIGALLESAAIFRVLWEAETVILPKTIDITIDYLRSARPVDTYAQGRITKQGRRVTSVHAWAWQEGRDRLVATAMAHFLILPPGERGA